MDDDLKKKLIVIVAIFFAATGFYYLASPYQNCIRSIDRGQFTPGTSGWVLYCTKFTKW